MAQGGFATPEFPPGLLFLFSFRVCNPGPTILGKSFYSFLKFLLFFLPQGQNRIAPSLLPTTVGKKRLNFRKTAHFHPPAAGPCLPIAVAWAPTCALPVVALDPSRSIVHVRMGTPKVAKRPYENYFPLYWSISVLFAAFRRK